jgi:hypothetical protein
MFNLDPQSRHLPVILLVLSCQRMMFGRLAGRKTVRIELQDSLISGIGVFLQVLQDAQPTAFQEGKIMGTPFATHHQENLQRLQTHDQLGCDRMPFLFARIILPLALDWSFNRLLGHVEQNGLKPLIQQGFLAWQPQVLHQPIKIPVIEFLGIRFADAKPATQFIKRAILPQIDQRQQQFLFQSQDTRLLSSASQGMTHPFLRLIRLNPLDKLAKCSAANADFATKLLGTTALQGFTIGRFFSSDIAFLFIDEQKSMYLVTVCGENPRDSKKYFGKMSNSSTMLNLNFRPFSSAFCGFRSVHQVFRHKIDRLIFREGVQRKDRP